VTGVNLGRTIFPRSFTKTSSGSSTRRHAESICCLPGLESGNGLFPQSHVAQPIRGTTRRSATTVRLHSNQFVAGIDIGSNSPNTVGPDGLEAWRPHVKFFAPSAKVQESS
jgi:hypothetical protein